MDHPPMEQGNILVTPCPECRGQQHEIMAYRKQGRILAEIIVKCLSCEHVWGFETWDDDEK